MPKAHEIDVKVFMDLQRKLELVVDSRLLHDRICYMPRLYLTIHRKRLACQWTVPYVVVAFATAHKITAVCRQYLPNFFFIRSHRR